MAAIRFTAAERPGLLAEAVLCHLSADGRADNNVLGELALAYQSHDGKAFDEALSRGFPSVAFARIGVGPPTVNAEPEPDPQPDAIE